MGYWNYLAKKKDSKKHSENLHAEEEKRRRHAQRQLVLWLMYGIRP